MKFQLQTLIDITNTGARRGDNELLYQQQQNYLTAVQTISLRANPIIEQKPYCKKINLKNLGFGSEYKNSHFVWYLDFEFESDFHNLDFLNKDFDLVPIIKGLKETANLEIQAFLTNDIKYKNINFVQIE